MTTAKTKARTVMRIVREALNRKHFSKLNQIQRPNGPLALEEAVEFYLKIVDRQE